MKPIEINLAEPFERVLTRVQSLPWCGSETGDNGSADDIQLTQAIRRLYEAANGRQVETPLGWIAIAPPVAAFLKARPFHVQTQLDLLIEAATRIISGPQHSNNGLPTPQSAWTTRHATDRRQPALDGTTDGRLDPPLGEPDRMHFAGTRLIPLRYD